MDLGTLFLELVFVLVVAGTTAAASALIVLLMFKASRTLVQMDIFVVMYITWVFWFLAINIIALAAQSDPDVATFTDFWPQVAFTLAYLIAFHEIFIFTQTGVQIEIDREIAQQKKAEKDRQQKQLLRQLKRSFKQMQPEKK